MDSSRNVSLTLEENIPSDYPEGLPSDYPEELPSDYPEELPSDYPEELPSDYPEELPSDYPEGLPSDYPEELPSDYPEGLPSDYPEELPSNYPEGLPSDYPEELPSDNPEELPSDYPEELPSDYPEELPSDYPEGLPSDYPEELPSNYPEGLPSDYPEGLPSDYPEELPSVLLSDYPEDADNYGGQSPHHHSEEQFQNTQETFNTDQDSGDIPLYPGASITVNIAMVLILAYAVRHKLTNEALSDSLYLIDKICPQPNNGCKSLYNFRKYFSHLLIPVNFCYYCINCFGLVSSSADTISLACGKTFTTIKDLCYFLHFSVSDQIKSLFTRKNFVNNIQHCLTKVHESNYEDIYDGLLYQQLMPPDGILACKNNISLTWNVDGLPLFKS